MVDYELKVSFYNFDTENSPYSLNGHNTHEFTFDLSKLETIVVGGHGMLSKDNEREVLLSTSEFFDETYVTIQNTATGLFIYSPLDSLAYLSKPAKVSFPSSFTMRVGYGLIKSEYTLIKMTGKKIKMRLEVKEKQNQTTVK